MVWLVTRKAGELWKELSDEDKSPWLEKSKVLKEEYEIAMNKYKQSSKLEPKESVKGKKKRGRPRKIPETTEVEVINITHDGQEYLLDEKSNDVYDMSHSKIGKYVDGKISMSA